MKKVRDYWKHADAIKLKTGSYPNDVFDFISLHFVRGKYSFIAPLCLCEQGQGPRPVFEQLSFRTKSEACVTLRTLCRIHKVKSVDCCDTDYQ